MQHLTFSSELFDRNSPNVRSILLSVFGWHQDANDARKMKMNGPVCPFNINVLKKSQDFLRFCVLFRIIAHQTYTKYMKILITMMLTSLWKVSRSPSSEPPCLLAAICCTNWGRWDPKQNVDSAFLILHALPQSNFHSFWHFLILKKFFLMCLFPFVKFTSYFSHDVDLPDNNKSLSWRKCDNQPLFRKSRPIAEVKDKACQR